MSTDSELRSLGIDPKVAGHIVARSIQDAIQEYYILGYKDGQESANVRFGRHENGIAKEHYTDGYIQGSKHRH